jgi:rubrerythrin
LAQSVDDQHRDAMRTVREELEEVHFGETASLLRQSRRQLLKKAGAGGALLTIGNMVVPFTRLLPAAAAQELTDIDIATFAASVELAAVQAYQVAIDSGKVTDAAVGAAATLFQSHHQEHAGAFNGLVTQNGGTEAGPNQAILDAFGPMLTGAADQTAILEIAFGLEQAAASTYLFALGALTVPEAYSATATILPIESQHAVVLGFVLGKAPADYLPSFESVTEGPGTAAALDPAQFPAG